MDISGWNISGTSYNCKDAAARAAIAAMQDSVATAFDDVTAYSVGDYVIYEDQLYQYTSAHAAGSWDADEVTTADIISILQSLAPLASPALSGTPTAPTAAVSTDSTQIATTAFVQDHAPIHFTGTASSGSSYTKSDAAITATMRVMNVVLGTPENVTSDLACTTAAGSVTFTGTFTGSTTIDFDVIEVN